MWLIVAKCGQVAIVRGQIEAFDSVRMRIQEGTDWCARVRVPYNKHRVFTAISSHDPPLILGAGSCSNLVTMALQQFLRLLLIVVNNSGVRRTVENLRTRVSRQIVHPLVNVFVEAKDPLEIQSRNSVALLVLRDFLAIVAVLHV